jgi:phosphoribosyl 1,2-cyclic phosphate phosphodiesterase
MKVTLLGTSSAEGWPALFCKCSACVRARQLGGKNIRTRSSAIIDDVLKIDFPPDVLAQSIRHNVDLTAIEAILFTHGHDDHCAGPEIQYRGKYFVSEAYQQDLPLYGSRDTLDKIQTAFHTFPDGSYDHSLYPVSFHALKPWEPTWVAGYKIVPITANHDLSRQCFNFLIEDAEGHVLLYATDTGWYSESTWERLRDYRADAAVIECSKGFIEGGYEGHLSFSQVVAFKQKLIDMGVMGASSEYYTTHLCHTCGLSHEELETWFAPYGIAPGYDGLTFRVTINSAVSVLTV